MLIGCSKNVLRIRYQAQFRKRIGVTQSHLGGEVRVMKGGESHPEG